MEIFRRSDILNPISRHLTDYCCMQHRLSEKDKNLNRNFDVFLSQHVHQTIVNFREKFWRSWSRVRSQCKPCWIVDVSIWESIWNFLPVNLINFHKTFRIEKSYIIYEIYFTNIWRLAAFFKMKSSSSLESCKASHSIHSQQVLSSDPIRLNIWQR